MLQEATEGVNERARARVAGQFAPSFCSDLFAPFLPILRPASKLNYSHASKGKPEQMLLNRDYVGHMASEVIKKLLEGNLVDIKEKDVEPMIARVRARMMEEITVEDKVNEEVRNILTQYQDEMRRTGISYQDMFKKVKGQLARDKKLILR
jgi:Protein of unknown function (DUF507)